MSEGISYRAILNEQSNQHGFGRSKSKSKALKKMKGQMTGRSQKEQMRFTRQNRDYQNKFKRAWND